MEYWMIDETDPRTDQKMSLSFIAKRVVQISNLIISL